MNCPQCSATVFQGARFCGACGAQLTAEESGYSSVYDEEKTVVGDSGTRSNQSYQSSYAGDATSANDSTANASSNQTYGNAPYTQASGNPNSFKIDSDARGQGRGYSFEILHQPSFALAILKLETEQAIQAEAGAMVSMSANIELQSNLKGGLMGALKRAVGGESAFISTFTARGGSGEVTLAPGGPGDIAAIEMNNQNFLVQSSSYLAGDIGLNINTQWGGAKSFFGGEGLFVLQVQGTGLLLLSSFGAIHRKRLNVGERYVVDTGHLVAWEAGMPYVLRKAASGFFRSFVSGEGIVSEFTGPGEILIQTRNLQAFAGLLRPFFPTQGEGGLGGFIKI